jgi:hypothetical protein
VHELVATGQVSLIKGTTVPVDVDGKIELRSAEEATQLFTTPGAARSATAGGLYDQQAEERASTPGAIAASAGIGVGNALALGFGKAAASGAGQVFAGDKGQEAVERYIAERELRNPYAMGAGEVAGLVAPAIVTGGASLLERGAAGGARGLLARGAVGAGELATAPLRGLGAIGDVGANLAERGAVAAGAAEGGALSRLAGHAARGAVEMPILEVGNAVSRSAIHDEPLTAEQLYAAGLHGALLGAVGGAAFGGVGSLVSGAGKLAGKVAERSGVLASELGLPAIPRTGNAVRDGLEVLADRKAIQASGANLGQIEKLGPEGGAFWKDVARTIREDLPGGGNLATMSKRELAEAAPGLAKRVGASREKLFGELEAAGAKGPDLQRVVDQIHPIEAELAADVAGRKLVPQVASTREFLQELATNGADFKAAQKQISSLKREVREAVRRGEGTLADQKQKIADLLDAELSRAGEDAIGGGQMGAEWAARLQQNNRDYAVAKWIEKATEKGAKAEARNRSAGMGEMLGAVAGASIGGIPFAVGTAVASNLVRRYGDQAIAQLAAKAAKSDAVKAIGGQVSHAITASAEAYASGGKAIRTAATSGPHVAVWQNEANEIYQRGKARSAVQERKDYQSKRDALAKLSPDLVRRHTEGLAELPGVRAQLEEQAVRAANFLRGKLPPEPVSLHPLQAGVTKPRDPPPSEIAKFERYSRAVDDPLSVVEDMARGRISRESVEALREVYPRMYGEAVGSVMAAIAQRKEPLSYDREKQLGVLLGVETTPMQSSALIRNAQAAYASQAPAQSMPGGPAPKAPKLSTKGFDIAGAALTPGQKSSTK